MSQGRAMENCHAERNRSYALWLESPVGSTPTLPFCLFPFRNSWLERLKWWLVFSSSSYHCQCSGPCLISRYSTVGTALPASLGWHLCPFGVISKCPGDTAGHIPTKCPGPSTITPGQPFRVLPGVWHRRMRGENMLCLMTSVTGKERNRWEIRPASLSSSLSPCFLAP